MSSQELPLPERRYTYHHYKDWPSETRYELYRGRAQLMGPSPTWNHQELVGHVCATFVAHFKGKPCRAFIAPLDVFLPAEGQSLADIDEADTIVQPDAGIVCDSSKIILDKGLWGAPDFVLEVLSPSSVLRDMNAKRAIYEASGVREYWILDARADFLLAFSLVFRSIWENFRT